MDSWQLSDAVYFEHTSCRSNQLHFASFHQCKVGSSVPSIFVFSSLLRSCDLHVHDCFSEWLQFSSIWFFPAQFIRRLVVCGCSLGSVQKVCRVLRSPHCVCQEHFYSVMFRTRMDQSSRRDVHLPDRSFDKCMLLRFRNATLFGEHTNWPNCFFPCCFNDLITFFSNCTCHFCCKVLRSGFSPRAALELFVGQLLLSTSISIKIAKPTQADNVLQPHLP